MRTSGKDGGGGGGGGGRVDNAFQAAFLERLLDHDQPGTALAAATAGPWEVAAAEGGRFRVESEGTAGADEPAAVVEERQAALLLAAALPASAERDLYRLRAERRDGGYELMRGGRRLGRLAWFDPHLVATVAALERIVASPRSLALLLEAAGHDALRRAGRLLASRLEGE
ncbi:MAG TPA: hypothetical protein VF100_11925 [Thermoanaerobaculia bacterium]